MPFDSTQPSPHCGSLTNDPDRFSDDAWNLLLNGEDLAQRWRHKQLDVEHLLQVLFSDRNYRKHVEALPIAIGSKLR